MQDDIFHLRCLAETAEPFSAGKRNGSATGKNLGRVIKKNFIYYAGGKRSPVHQRAAFNQQAGNLQLSKASYDPGKIRTSVTGAERNLFHTDAMFFELATFLFLREGAEDQHVILRGLDQA